MFVFIVYLKVQGVDPTKHPINFEMKRIQEYMNKVKNKEAEQKNNSPGEGSSDNQQPEEKQTGKRRTSKIISSILNQAALDNFKDVKPSPSSSGSGQIRSRNTQELQHDEVSEINELVSLSDPNKKRKSDPEEDQPQKEPRKSKKR